MIPIVYVRNSLEDAYENHTFWSSFSDRFKILHQGDIYIDDLNLKITKVEMPPNFYEESYSKNMVIALKRSKSKEAILAPKTKRLLDFKLFKGFQKEFFGYSVAKSIELMLRVRKKSIKNSCIVIYDAADSIMKEVIYELAKKAEYIVMVSHNINMLNKLQDSVMAEFGVTPIITADVDFAIQCADFVICSRQYVGEYKSPIWFVDNSFVPEGIDFSYANDVVYKTPWDRKEITMSPEVLSAILYQMQEKDIEKSLRYNGIYLSEIRFNDSIL